MSKKAPPIVLVVFNGVEPLDVSGPASVFTRAKRHCPHAPDIIIASPRGGEVQTSAGFALANTRRLASLRGPFDAILVAGGDETSLRRAIVEEGLDRWLARSAKSARRIGSICTGAFALAAAGLLDGRRATTHWSACEELQRRFPKAAVEPDAIHVIDGAVCTSAGVSAGIDLALALVETDFGGDVAAQIARELVLFLRRPGGQSQFSVGASAQHNAGDRMRAVVSWILEHVDADLSVPTLALRAGMSDRNFARVFSRETGMSPARFVLAARLDHAKLLLETTTWPLERVAERAGLGSIDSLQRLFRASVGVAPSDYRARFAHKKRAGGSSRRELAD
jgi:transcriptional regulator GlxA family with amidase domain